MTDFIYKLLFENERFWLAISAICSILLVRIAFRGLGIWKNEHLGKHQIDLAMDILILFYEVRDTIHSIRNPFSYEEDSNFSDASRYANMSHTVLKRIDKNKEIFYKLDAYKNRFKVKFNKDLKPFDNIKDIINEIQVSAINLADLANKNNVDEGEVEKYGVTIMGLPQKKDPINDRLDDVIKYIEKICKPIFRK
ncbi:MAG: hypothetical protein GY750_19115 [Lentisphaerae bacterium]|nr:hypothetical protein [Lentisphaerota bacterium]MCP4103509.1 hypothetical protein [Lentisphaerota bacterium]